MANVQNDNFLLKGKKHLDARRLRLDGTPWISVAEVNAAFIDNDRVESQIYFIVDKEYWYLGGTADIDLIEKKTGTEYVDSSTIHFEPTTASVKDNSITPAKLQPIATARILGNIDGGTNNPKALNVSEVKTMLALENVDNTSDANKPVSIAQQLILDAIQVNSKFFRVNGNYTLQQADSGKYILISGNSRTITIPNGLTGEFHITLDIEGTGALIVDSTTTMYGDNTGLDNGTGNNYNVPQNGSFYFIRNTVDGRIRTKGDYI